VVEVDTPDAVSEDVAEPDADFRFCCFYVASPCVWVCARGVSADGLFGHFLLSPFAILEIPAHPTIPACELVRDASFRAMCAHAVFGRAEPCLGVAADNADSAPFTRSHSPIVTVFAVCLQGFRRNGGAHFYPKREARQWQFLGVPLTRSR